MVSEKKIFEGSLVIKAYVPWGVASLDPRGLIGRIYVGDHYTLLHTKHISCGHHGFREEDFFLSFKDEVHFLCQYHKYASQRKTLMTFYQVLIYPEHSMS